MEGNVFLCVAGLTPQIITESLYVLTVQDNIEINEVKVITSKIGKKIVKERLFDSGVWQKFCKDYADKIANIRFNMDCLEVLQDADEIELPDIRTTEENEAAANQICKIVRKLTDYENTTIYASVAGGRKTMGNYLGFAMSLFARTRDRLSHVLVDEEFERFRKPALNFYYEPPIPEQVLDIEGNKATTMDGKPLMTDMANTTLANIPFVRLRRILPENYGEKPKDYQTFVDQVQRELDLLETNHDLIIDLIKSEVRISSEKFHLSPCEMMMCVIFALQRKDVKREKNTLLYDEIGIEHFDEAIRKITKSTGVEYGLDRVGGTPFDFLTNYLLRKGGKIASLNRSYPNEKRKEIKLSKTLYELVGDYNKKLETERIPERFMIKAKEKNKNIPHNWIAVLPDNIKFIEREDEIHFSQFGRFS